MITLITGAPGSGKSAALVDLLTTLAKDRPLYVDGVPDLQVRHEVLDEVSRWHELVPDGAAVVVDEAQRVWRPRGVGSKVPPDIAALETHRHRGLDFFLVTQQPALVDKNVRALVGRHVHLRDLGVLGRWWYEWPECSESVSWRTAPIKRKYRLPKRVFSLYKSASMHVKPIRSVPWVLGLMVVALLVTAVLGWFVYQRIAAHMAPPAAKPVEAMRQGEGQVIQLSSAAAAARPARAELTGAEILLSFTPRVSFDPASAPAYDEIRRVVVMPRVAGGFCMRGRCKCVTQQGTDAGLSDDDCRAWIANPPFDPYRQEAELPRASDRAALPTVTD